MIVNIQIGICSVHSRINGTALYLYIMFLFIQYIINFNIDFYTYCDPNLFAGFLLLVVISETEKIPPS